MNLYEYNGPVMQFDICVSNNWKGVTRAVSEAKARSNLMYQYKKQNGLMPNAKIGLPGMIFKI